MDLAKLTVRLEAQSAQLLTELEKANTKIDRFASKSQQTLTKWVGGITAAFSARAIATYAKDVIDVGDNLTDMAQKAGSSATVLTQLGYAAKQNGSDLEGLSDAFVKLANNMQAANDGSKQQQAAFDALGVKYKNTDGTLRSTDEVFKDIAESASQYADGASKSAVAVDLLGKSGATLIPTLNLGREGLADLADEADRVGATINDKTAQALGDFNDQLDKLTLSAQGVVASALAPVLKDIADAMDDATAKGQGFAQFTSSLEFSFRVLADVGYSVYKTFHDIGTALGALGAAAVSAATGDFKRARDIMRMASEDQRKSEEESNAFLAKLWGDRTDTIKKSTDKAQELIAQADAALKKSLVYGGAQRVSPVQEVTVTGATKIDKSATEQFYDDLDSRSQTSTEKQVAQYHEVAEAANALYESGRISLEQYQQRREEALDDLLPEFEVTVKKVQEIAKTANEYEIQAARNTQDIIADTFTTLATEGDISAKSLLRSFGDMIIKLTAQAAAADLAGRLFGKAGGGEGEGWIGTAANLLAGAFGGTRDRGGRGEPGRSYLIGTGAQPERFIPDVPGTFVPAGAGGMGMQVHNQFTINTEQPVTRRTEEQVAAAAARGVARANRRAN